MLTAIALICISCAGTDTLSAIRNADARDHSTLYGQVMTPYGSGHAYRVNPNTNQDATITAPDGTKIEIKSH